MEESFLPWWLMLLLGMWAVALALWQTSSIHREVRLWSGLASLVYLALVFLALRNGSRAPGAPSSIWWLDGLATLGSMGCIAISLIAGVWLLGRAPLHSRRLSYLVLTCANAGVCVLMGELEIAIALLIVALISSRPIRELVRPFQVSLAFRGLIAELVQFVDEPIRPEDAGRFLLTCGVNSVLACAIIGTVGYSLRVETTRIAQSPRYTALPSREDVVHRPAGSNESVGVPALFDFAFGTRADVVVLLAVIVFLGLAISMNDSTSGPLSQTDSNAFPDFESHPRELA